MKTKLITTIILLITTQITVATVCTQTSNSIGLVGLDYNNNSTPKTTTIFVAVSNHDNQCGCPIIRFKEENTNIDVVLDILLAAKTNYKKVRINLLDANDCRSAFGVYIQ